MLNENSPFGAEQVIVYRDQMPHELWVLLGERLLMGGAVAAPFAPNNYDGPLPSVAPQEIEKLAITATRDDFIVFCTDTQTFSKAAGTNAYNSLVQHAMHPAEHPRPDNAPSLPLFYDGYSRLDVVGLQKYVEVIDYLLETSGLPEKTVLTSYMQKNASRITLEFYRQYVKYRLNPEDLEDHGYDFT